MNPKYYLIWKERTDRNYFHREFPDRESLNDFLTALREDNVVSVKVISGYTLEDRS